MSDPRSFARHLVPRLAGALAPHGASVSLPREAFVDAASFALDAATLFAGRNAVAHPDDLARPGAWARASLPGRSDLAVLRTDELDLVLISTLCRHRGVPLLEGPAGHLRNLELPCRYHGWLYDVRGALRRAPGLDAPKSLEGITLRVGAAAAIGPVVFAALDGSGAPAEPSLPPWLERAELDVLRRVHTASHVVAANWKIVVGNFQESHHFPHVHPGLDARTPWRATTSVLPDHDRWIGGVMQLAPGLETVSASGTREGRRFLAAQEDRGSVHDAWLAPNLLTSLQPDYLLTYRLEPEAVDRTRIVFAIDVHAGSAERETAEGIEALIRFWSTTNAEDRSICEAQHRGLASGPVDLAPGLRVTSEDGLDAFEKIVARAYAAYAAGSP